MSLAPSLITQLVLAPVVLPALAAPLAVLLLIRHRTTGLVVSFASCLALLGVAIALLVLSADGTVRTYEVGDWPAPFGIVLVLYRLSAIMLTLTAALAPSWAPPSSSGLSATRGHTSTSLAPSGT